MAAATTMTMTMAAPRAHACVDGPTMAAIAIGALIIPSELGATTTRAPEPATKVVIGWSWQVPVRFGESPYHRVVAGVDLEPGPGGVAWRGRAGYRYMRRHAFGGMGGTLATGGFTLSPEIGVKFAHATPPSSDPTDPAVHLLARVEVEPTSGQLRAATLLLGWTVF
jgi:hypothetical protein